VLPTTGREWASPLDANGHRLQPGEIVSSTRRLTPRSLHPPFANAARSGAPGSNQTPGIRGGPPAVGRGSSDLTPQHTAQSRSAKTKDSPHRKRRRRCPHCYRTLLAGKSGNVPSAPHYSAASHGVSLNTVPKLHMPPVDVVPYRLPAASRTKPA
jgi:hypothetical protein